jgi:Tol biopolymer transport system component/DNA-binding winged helix-turn-helix (wHTH) protein
MEQAAVSPRIYRFGDFEVFADTAELRKNGVRIKLQGQPFQILVMLLQVRGEVVTRDVLRTALWPADTFVDFEHSLNTAVKKLRQAIGDTAENPRFIETLPRIGYRFLLPDKELAPVIAIAQPAHSAPHRLRVKLLMGLLAVCLAVAAFMVGDWLRSPYLRIIGTRQLTFTGDICGGLESDGRHLYYFRIFDHSLHSLPVDGGTESSFPSRFNGPVILHISPDGSHLLVKEFAGDAAGPTERIWLQPTNGGPARPLGDIEAQFAAAFSPDGKVIAFAQHKTIYLTPDEGATYHRLLEAPGEVSWIRWSPDGKHLRFTVNDLKTNVGSLWESEDGGKIRRVQTGLEPSANACCGIWTRDSRHFLFSVFRNERWDLWNADEHWSPFRSGKPLLVTAGGPEIVTATTSPIEDRMFVAGYQSSTASFKFDLAHRALTPFLPNRSVEDPSFSADGKSLVYCEQHTEQSVVWRSNSDGTDAVPLTDPKLYARWPHFSPNGKRIAFMGKWPDKPWQIFWISVEGGALHEIHVPVISQADVNWMPDSQSILFGQTPWYLADPDSPRAIYLHNLQTGSLEKVPGSDGWFSPRLAPDARSFVALSADEHKLALYDFATSQWRVLEDSQGPIGAPFWSPDGKWIYLNQHARADGIDRNGSVLRIRARDGVKDKVLAFSEFLAEPSCNGWTTAQDGSIMVSCWQANANVYDLKYE